MTKQPEDVDGVSRDDDAHLLSGAYALDALSPEERERFEAALAESEELRAEAAGLTDTAALLGRAAEPVEPSAALKASLFAELANTPQLSATPAEGPANAAPPLAVPETPAEQKATRRWYARPLTYVAAVAAVIVLLVAGVSLANFGGPNGWGAQRQLDQLVAASDTQNTSGPVTGGGEVTVIWSESLNRSAVMVTDMADLDDSQVYELWVIDDAGATSVGTFVPGEDGSTWRVIDGTMNPGDTLGITVEPEGGSDQPTTEPIALVSA